jgi:hypothetical protein
MNRFQFKPDLPRQSSSALVISKPREFLEGGKLVGGHLKIINAAQKLAVAFIRPISHPAKTPIL